MKNEFPQPRLKVYTHSLAASGLSDHGLVGDEARKLLMITDFSQSAAHAESRAAMLSMQLDYQPLEIMAVMNSGLQPASHSRRLAAVSEDEHEDVSHIESGLRNVALRLQKWEKLVYICSIRFGNPISGIVGRAEEMDAFVTVIGSYGGSIATNLTRGYSTVDVVRAIARPVLVVKQEPLQPYGKVLIAIDFSEASVQAVLTAMALAPDAEFELLHVLEDAKFMALSGQAQSNESRLARLIGEERTAKSRLSKLIAELGMEAERVSLVVRQGFPSSAIHERAKEIDADLVACGKQSCSGTYNQALGSVAMGMLVQSTCDVLVACAPSEGASDFDRPAA